MQRLKILNILCQRHLESVFINVFNYTKQMRTVIIIRERLQAFCLYIELQTLRTCPV
ncbi:hypothetical protein E2626_02390 [Jeotgalibacillus salarius]|uniref:Uncharacterized protein n=1 Tax=Jeotgalibacillus salarius TaxID=546023 RepID=A0A4Y8LP68_9BACL|nr:hypothetical protein E2626_02390 [Jeotgalibacillus salarius]